MRFGISHADILFYFQWENAITSVGRNCRKSSGWIAMNNVYAPNREMIACNGRNWRKKKKIQTIKKLCIHYYLPICTSNKHSSVGAFLFFIFGFCFLFLVEKSIENELNRRSIELRRVDINNRMLIFFCLPCVKCLQPFVLFCFVIDITKWPGFHWALFSVQPVYGRYWWLRRWYLVLGFAIIGLVNLFKISLFPISFFLFVGFSVFFCLPS